MTKVPTPLFIKGCDICGEDRKLRLYPTDNGVIEVCDRCAHRTKRMKEGAKT